MVRIVTIETRAPTVPVAPTAAPAGGAGAGAGAAAEVAARPKKRARIVARFRTDFSVCGIAPFGEALALLGYQAPDEDGPLQPELYIVTRDIGDELSNDALPIRGFEDNAAIDYK